MIFLLSTFTLSADQNLSSPHLTAMAAEFELTQEQRDARLGGIVQFSFYTIAGICSLVFGPLSQVVEKKKLLLILLAMSGTASLCASLVVAGRSGFFWFLLARSFAGISFGGALPVVFSCVSEIVPNTHRTLASGAVGSSAAAGAAIGQVVAGLMGSWRLGYRSHSVVAIVVGCLVWLSEPRKSDRGASPPLEDAFSSPWGVDVGKSRGFRMEDLEWDKFAKILRVPSNRLIFAQAIPGCVGWSVIGTFLADFLYADCARSKAQATAILAIFGICCLGGSIVGASIGQGLYNKDKSTLPRFIATCAVGGSIPLMLLVLTAGKGRMILSIMFAMFAALEGVPGPNIKGIVMGVNKPEERGVVFSFYQLVDSLGKATGPFLVSVLAWVLGSRTVAFCLAFLGWWLSAWLIDGLQRTIRFDAQKIEVSQSWDMSQHYKDV